jgi:hypothetical protein
MADFELPINLAVLKAADAYAGREETRYYLKGVHIEANESGIYYVATDGHMLFVRRETADVPVNPFVGDLIIPSETIAEYKVRNNKPLASLFVGDNYSIRYQDLRREFKPIVGTFPEWRKVLPKMPETPVAAQFNAKYIGKLARTAEQLGLGMPFIHHAGDGNAAPVTWQTNNDTLAVIMPMRIVAGSLPEWAQIAA